MNRRGFLGALLAGAVAPAFLPGAGRLWKPAPKKLVAVINPDYVSAPYECLFLWDADIFQAITYNRFEPSPTAQALLAGNNTLKQAYPVRFSLDNGIYTPIPPFKLLT